MKQWYALYVFLYSYGTIDSNSQAFILWKHVLNNIILDIVDG